MPPVDFNLTRPLPEWGACIRFDLSAASPDQAAIPCSEVPVTSVSTGTFFARLLAGWLSGRLGVRGTASGSLPVSAQAAGQVGAQGTAAGAAGHLAGNAQGVWDPNVWRGPSSQTRDTYTRARATSIDAGAGGFTLPWEIHRRLRPEGVCPFEDASRRAASIQSTMLILERTPAFSEIAWTWATPIPALYNSLYIHAGRLPLFRSFQWQDADPRRLETRSDFVLGWPRKRSWDFRYQTAQPRPTAPLGIAWLIPGRWKRGAPQWWIPWESTRRPPFIWPPASPPEPPPPEPYTGDPNFDLRCALPLWNACIRFDLALSACHAAVPCFSWPRRYIIVINTLSLLTLPDGTPVPCEAMEIRTDLDSWTWAFRAGFKSYPPAWLIEDQREVEATINGHAFRFVLESYDEGSSFASLRSSVAGRSLSAYLATPYELPRSRIEASARTAHQCAEDELYGTGWELSWQPGPRGALGIEVVDWLISAGAFAYEAETPLSAIKLLAEACGAVVRTDPTAKRLTVLSRYPVSTWDLAAATPDVTIPADLITSLSRRWVPEPLYRGVWVSGREQGVSVRVIRAGTDGDPYREMIVNPLVTHVDAGRERGRNILCAGGRRAAVTLVIPLKDGTGFPGLILPGQLVRVDQSPSWMAYATGLSISAAHGKVWQTVELERVIETP